MRGWTERCEWGDFSAYIPRVPNGLLLGRLFRRPDGAPLVEFRIRPKSEVFRVSEPVNPLAQNRIRTRNPRTRNPWIPGPSPPDCHCYIIHLLGSRNHQTRLGYYASHDPNFSRPLCCFHHRVLDLGDSVPKPYHLRVFLGGLTGKTPTLTITNYEVEIV